MADGLAAVAVAMYADIHGGRPWCHRTLRHGLELVLAPVTDRWRLALGRAGAPPSDIEVELVKTAFAVPAGVAVARSQKQRQVVGEVGQLFHIAEMFWAQQEEGSDRGHTDDLWA